MPPRPTCGPAPRSRCAGRRAGGAGGADQAARRGHARARAAQLTRGLTGVALSGWRAPRRVSEARATEVVAQPELPAWDLVDIERYRAVWIRRTATSASTWPPRAAARSVAPGAPSRSGATSTRSAAPTPSPPRFIYLKRQLQSGPHLVRRRHLRLPARLGAAIRPRGARGAARACPSPSRPRRPDHRGHGRRRCAEAGCARGLARGRERQPAHPGRHEQGHDGGGDLRRARTAEGAGHPRRLLHPARLPRRSSSPTSSPRASCWRRRARTTSASASPIRCRAPSSTSRSRSQLERQDATGRTAAIWR